MGGGVAESGGVAKDRETPASHEPPGRGAIKVPHALERVPEDGKVLTGETGVLG